MKKCFFFFFCLCLTQVCFGTQIFVGSNVSELDVSSATDGMPVILFLKNNKITGYSGIKENPKELISSSEKNDNVIHFYYNGKSAACKYGLAIRKRDMYEFIPFYIENQEIHFGDEIYFSSYEPKQIIKQGSYYFWIEENKIISLYGKNKKDFSVNKTAFEEKILDFSVKGVKNSIFCTLFFENKTILFENGKEEFVEILKPLKKSRYLKNLNSFIFFDDTGTPLFSVSIEEDYEQREIFIEEENKGFEKIYNHFNPDEYISVDKTNTNYVFKMKDFLFEMEPYQEIKLIPKTMDSSFLLVKTLNKENLLFFIDFKNSKITQIPMIEFLKNTTMLSTIYMENNKIYTLCYFDNYLYQVSLNDENNLNLEKNIYIGVLDFHELESTIEHISTQKIIIYTPLATKIIDFKENRVENIEGKLFSYVRDKEGSLIYGYLKNENLWVGEF